MALCLHQGAVSFRDVCLVGFDISACRPPRRELWFKKMKDLSFYQVFQSDTKLYAVNHDKDGTELLEIDPRTGNSSKIFSLERLADLIESALTGSAFPACSELQLIISVV